MEKKCQGAEKCKIVQINYIAKHYIFMQNNTALKAPTTYSNAMCVKLVRNSTNEAIIS